MAKQDFKVKASTQEHLDIEDIVEDLVVLKTGWVALVMSTTAVNFDILSEAEQDATIYAYGALLNSLSFPIQILIRSKKADITSYFHRLAEAEATQPNPDLKRQIQKYEDFLQSTVQQKTVLDKKFYMIINYSSLEKGVHPAAFSAKSQTKKASKAQLVADAKIILYPKRDHLIKQSARLGLSSKQLQTQELIELYYDIYNPAPSGTQRILLDSSSYTTPLVQPAIEVPAPAPTITQLRNPQPTIQPEVQTQQPFGNIITPRQTTPLGQQPEVAITAQTVPTAPIPVQQPQPIDSQQEALAKLQEASNLAKQILNQQSPTTNIATNPDQKTKF